MCARLRVRRGCREDELEVAVVGYGRVGRIGNLKKLLYPFLHDRYLPTS